MPIPVTKSEFRTILRSQNILWNESRAPLDELDLGDKFEVVGKHCAGVLNQFNKRFPGFEPDGVLSADANCRLFSFTPCVLLPDMTFVEIKFAAGELEGRDLGQGRLMVDWLARAHTAEIARGYLPSLIYVTTMGANIPGSLIGRATQQSVRMAQYVIAYDTVGSDIVFSSLPVVALNTIPQRRGMPAHTFSRVLRSVPLSVMRLSLTTTRFAP